MVLGIMWFEVLPRMQERPREPVIGRLPRSFSGVRGQERNLPRVGRAFDRWPVRLALRRSRLRTRRPLLSRPLPSRNAISCNSGESMRQAISASSSGSTSPRSLADSFQLAFEPKQGFEQFGLGLCGTSEDQAVLACDDSRGIASTVEPKADQGGTKPTRPDLGIGRHPGWPLTRVACGQCAWEGSSQDKTRTNYRSLRWCYRQARHR